MSTALAALLDAVDDAKAGMSSAVVCAVLKPLAAAVREEMGSLRSRDEASLGLADGELLPCPFCDGVASTGGQESPSFRMCRVWCDDCGAKTANYRTPEQAAEMWNQRSAVERRVRGL